MPDPITIGTLVAAALVGGATEAGKGVLGGVAKDAYEALKSVASRILGLSVDQLEAKPESGSRAGVVAELVAEQPEPVQLELRDLADALRKALEAGGTATPLTQMFNQFNNSGSGQQFNAPGGTQNFGAGAFGGNSDT